MAVRIVHTADNHLGISFKQYPEGVRKRLLQERIDALRSLVEEGNARKAHFLVVAGDLFDKVSVQRPIIDEAVKVLACFEGEAVLVLAGNHDYYEGGESTLWQRFQKAAEGTCVHALLRPQVEHFEVDGQAVAFYPCPCPAKYGQEPMTGWVNTVDKPAGTIHIGIAHGNVEGLGLDADQRYFNMSERGLQEAGLHTWLLGHIHVPSPLPGITGRQTFYMSGIHTPDSVKVTRAGHAWYLEIEADGTIRHASLQPGKVIFKRIVRELGHADDIATLRKDCSRLNLPDTVLDLQLSGRLNREDVAQLNSLLAELAESCLHLSDERQIHPVLDAAAIDALFPPETLPHRLLNTLAADQQHPEDVHLALDLINDLRRP
jgi:DNA repair protein SbcD/Mre11